MWMIRVAAIVALLLLPAGVLPAAEPEWFRLESEKFEFYSSGNKRTSRDTLRRFEEVRQIFLQAMPEAKETDGKIRVIAFGSVREYTAYRPGNYAIAYYLYGGEQDLIVLSDTGARVEAAAVHEYIHLLVRVAGLHLPPWLNEGFAELYSTMKPHAGGVLIGTPLPERLLSIRQSRWVPLSMILATDQAAHAGATSEQATTLYNLGWALTHMLALKEGYRDRWDDFMAEISSGKDSRTVLESVYGRPLAKIEADLQAYVRASQYTGVVLPVKLVRNRQEFRETPVAPLDARIMLAELKSRVGKGADRSRELQALVTEFPQRPEPYAALGYLAWMDGDTPGALSQFAKSYDRGNRDHKFLSDYGNLVNPSDSKRGAEIFGLLVSADPDNVKYRLGQGWALMNNSDVSQARSVLAPIRKVAPSDAARLFRLQAAIEVKLGDYTRALAFTERWLEHEKEPGAKQVAASQADGLKKAIAAIAQGAKVQVVGPNAKPREQADGPPHMIRREDEGRSSFTVVTRPLSNVTGDFVRLDCRGAQANIILRTGEGLIAFLIDDHEKVLIDDTNGLKLEFNCGAQKPIKVELRYVPPPDGAKGIAGLVRGLKRLQ